MLKSLQNINNKYQSIKSENPEWRRYGQCDASVQNGLYN